MTRLVLRFALAVLVEAASAGLSTAVVGISPADAALVMPRRSEARPTPERAVGPAIDSPAEVFALASTVYAEARGEPELGQVAVAHVVLTRARARGWSIERTVRQPRQFSCWDRGRRIPRDRHARQAFSRALRVASAVLSGQVADPTGGADHYHSTCARPAWSRTMTPRGAIGGHLFYAA